MITLAVERNGFVYVYGENNRSLFQLTGELYGYTSSTVSVKRGNFIYTFDDKNRSLGSRPAR